MRHRCSHPLGTEGASACIGEDAAGRWAWFESDASRTEPKPIPADLSDADALRALCHLPGWRLSCLAGLELGGRVVVAGDGWLARTTLTVCALRGCLWRASAAHTHDTPLAADYLVPRALSLLEAQRRRVLPGAPDAVILTSALPERLLQATQVCRARGTVVVSGAGWPALDFGFYPDVHKRGLHVVLTDMWGLKRGEAAAQDSILGLSQAIVTAGVELP